MPPIPPFTGTISTTIGIHVGAGWCVDSDVSKFQVVFLSWKSSRRLSIFFTRPVEQRVCPWKVTKTIQNPIGKANVFQPPFLRGKLLNFRGVPFFQINDNLATKSWFSWVSERKETLKETVSSHLGRCFFWWGCRALVLKKIPVPTRTGWPQRSEIRSVDRLRFLLLPAMTHSFLAKLPSRMGSLISRWTQKTGT